MILNAFFFWTACFVQVLVKESVRGKNKETHSEGNKWCSESMYWKKMLPSCSRYSSAESGSRFHWLGVRWWLSQGTPVSSTHTIWQKKWWKNIKIPCCLAGVWSHVPCLRRQVLQRDTGEDHGDRHQRQRPRLHPAPVRGPQHPRGGGPLAAAHGEEVPHNRKLIFLVAFTSARCRR